MRQELLGIAKRKFYMGIRVCVSLSLVWGSLTMLVMLDYGLYLAESAARHKHTTVDDNLKFSTG